MQNQTLQDQTLYSRDLHKNARLLRAITAIKALSWMILFLGGLLIIPTAFDLADNHNDWRVYGIFSFGYFFLGASLWLACRDKPTFELTLREAFLITVACWVISAVAASLPIYFAVDGLDFASAIFEGTSGLTTTGATILFDIDDLPRGILIWRSLLQAYGGIGVILVSKFVLPSLKIGGTELLEADSSSETGRILTNITNILTRLAFVYIGMMIANALLYRALGMSNFDALIHGLTTFSTGGFSSHDTSIGYFNSPGIEWVAIFFMIAGGIPLMLWVQASSGSALAIFRDRQVRLFLTIMVLLIGVVYAGRLLLEPTLLSTEDGSLRRIMFTTVALLTGAGFTSYDYSGWGGFFDIIFFFICMIGGCTGSTTGGIKAWRLAVAGKVIWRFLVHASRSHAVYQITVFSKNVGESAISSMFLFIVLFFTTLMGFAIVYNMLGLDFVTALSASLSAVGNIGPGLGTIIGPAGNFSTLGPVAKLLFSLEMVLGRLEIIIVVVLAMPSFWRR